MNKAYKTYLVLLGIVLVILTVLELNKKPVIDWSLNYKTDKKSPFGLYIFNQEADKLFDNNLERTTEQPYVYLEKDTLRKPQNYLFIQKRITKEVRNYLLKEVKKGSSVFYISSRDHHFSLFADTLNFRISRNFSKDLKNFKLTDVKLKNSIDLKEDFNSYYFRKITPKTTQILGYKEECRDVGEKYLSCDKKVIFIKVNYGKGQFYFLSDPILLINYYLKEQKNQKAIEGLFSYLPKRKTVWFQNELAKKRNDMSFILKNSSLRSAWYLVAVTLLLFVFFNAKRRQRIIPIITPKQNKSVEFIKNIGNLYLQEGNAHDMAQKKVQYFLNKIRNELYLNTDHLDDEFAKKLQQKTNQPIEDIEKALKLINNVLQPKKPISEIELIELNKVLDKVYL
ncbi:MAG: hypothetical protein KGV44_01250 [Flavobacteriaceae bacterium]|nr:hypothetical protein [Flavobacteriaceae bacterium]